MTKDHLFQEETRTPSPSTFISRSGTPTAVSPVNQLSPSAVTNKLSPSAVTNKLSAVSSQLSSTAVSPQLAPLAVSQQLSPTIISITPATPAPSPTCQKVIIF